MPTPREDLPTGDAEGAAVKRSGLRGFLGRAWGRTESEIIGFAVGGAAQPALGPLMKPLVYKVNSEFTNERLQPEVMADLAARGHVSIERARADAHDNGIDDSRLDLLIAAASRGPDLGMLLDLLRRGEITVEQFSSGLADNGMFPEWREFVGKLRTVPLSPADAAMARQQGFVTDARSRDLAALSGVDGETSDLMYELSGLPPGITEALDLLRRGKIDRAMFAQIVREGHTKTKYTDILLELLEVPIPTSIAVEGVIRERITPDEGAAMAAKHGVSASDFKHMTEVMGRAMGTMEALTLVNRGYFTEAQFREVVARSDVRTEYTDALLELRHKFPPLFQVGRLVTAGALTDDQAVEIIRKEGYSDEVAHGIVKSSHHEAKSKHRDITLANIEVLHESGLLNNADAIADIVKLGYSDSDARELLEILDARRIVSAQTRAIGVIHNKYVNHMIDRQAAMGELDILLANHSARDTLLGIWDKEREANIRRLTPSQVGQAYKHNIITAQEAVARWVGLGYPLADAQVLAEIVNKGRLDPLPLPA